MLLALLSLIVVIVLSGESMRDTKARDGRFVPGHNNITFLFVQVRIGQGPGNEPYRCELC